MASGLKLDRLVGQLLMIEVATYCIPLFDAVIVVKWGEHNVCDAITTVFDERCAINVIVAIVAGNNRRPVCAYSMTYRTEIVNDLEITYERTHTRTHKYKRVQYDHTLRNRKWTYSS